MYTLEQLEFLHAHLGVAIPAAFIANRRLAENPPAPIEPVVDPGREARKQQISQAAGAVTVPPEMPATSLDAERAAVTGHLATTPLTDAALDLADESLQALIKAGGELDELSQRLAEARGAVAKLDQPVSSKEAGQIQKDLIEPALQKAGTDRAGASALLDQVGTAISTAEKGAEAYVAALRSAEEAVRSLVHPSIATDAGKITSDFIATAQGKAATGDRAEAMALLEKVAPACAVAQQEAAKYDEALAAAESAVGTLTDPVVKLDAEKIKTDFIEAGKTKGSGGDCEGALALFSEVAGACATAKREAEAYAAALHSAEEAARLLVHPAIVKDAEKIKADFITTAQSQAATGDRTGAMGLLEKVAPACAVAQQEAVKYDQALAAAGIAVGLLNQPVSLVEVQKIRTDFIEAGQTKVTTAGDREGALALFAQVADACATAQQGVGAYAATLHSAEEAVRLLVHPAIAKDAEKITSDFITAAQGKAATGDRLAAMALLEKVAPAGETAKAEALKYDLALAAAETAVGLLTQPVVKLEVQKIKTDLIAAGKTKVSASGDRAGALALFGQVAAACAAAKKIVDDYEAALQAANDAVALLTHLVVKPEVTALKTETIGAAKTAATAGNSGTAMSLLAQAAKRCTLAKVHTQRYVDGLALAERRFNALKSECQGNINYWATVGPLIGVSDVLPDIETENIGGARTKATAGDYLNAMALLEAVSNRLRPVRKKHSEFDQFSDKWIDCDALFTGSKSTVTSFTIAAPAIDTLLAAIKTETLKQGDTDAIGGDYVKALATVTAFDSRHAVAEDMITKHQQFETDRGTAVTRINTLTNADIAADKTLVTTDRVDAADTKVVAGKYDEALALLAKVDGECTVIADYGTKLTAAKAAVALLTQPELAGDKARIQRERIDAAVALAAAWNHAGAMTQLASVAAECDEAKAVVTGATEVGQAKTAAQTKINDVKTAPEPAFKAVEDMVAALDSAGDLLKDERKAIRDKIALARTALATPSAGDPKALLEEAAAACGPARLIADRDAQYQKALTKAKALVLTLTEAIIAKDKETIEKDRLKKAADAIKAPGRDYAGALAELAKVQAECATAKAIAAQDAAYQLALTAAESELTPLTEPLIATDKTKIDDDYIKVAKTKATTRAYQAAMDLLAQVKGECDKAKKVVADDTAYKAKLSPIESNLATARSNLGIIETNYGFTWAPMRATLDDISNNYVDDAKTKATARNYAGATAALKLGKPKLNTAFQDIDDLDDAFLNLKKANTDITALGTHAGAAAVTTEIAALKKLHADGVALRTAKQYSAATDIGLEIQDGCTAATTIAVLHAAYAPKLATAKARMVTCTSKVNGLSPAVPEIAKKLSEVQTNYVAAAETNVEGREYAGATKLLDKVEAECIAVELLVTQHGQFVTALAAAESALLPLTQPVVADDVKKIRQDRVAAAKTLATALDYKEALALLAKVKPECDALTVVATGHETASQEGEAAKKLHDGTPDGNAKALAEVEKMLKALTEQHPARAAIKDRTDPIGVALATAKTLSPQEAKAKIEAIADQCVAARELGDRHEEYLKLLTPAEGLVNTLTEPSIATDKADITRDRIAAAKTKAAAHDYRGAQTLLEGVAAACAKAKALAAEFDLYTSELATAESTLNTLGALTPLDPVIGADAQKIKDECIEAAKTLALPATRDFAGARKLLAKVDSRCKTIALKKKMAGGNEPTKGEIDDIIALEGGKAMLDQLIANLPETTKRSVVQAAIQARFNVKLKNYTKDGVKKDKTAGKSSSLTKLYELMAMVPDSHTDNIKIDRYGGDAGEDANSKRGSFYRSSEKRIVLSCGRAKDGDPHPLEDVIYALPDVDPDCELIPDGPDSPTPKYFDWTSLHELGHSIDDKKQFMPGKEGNTKFGNWTTHGRNVMPIAKAAAAHFNFPEAYIAAYLLNGKGNPPNAPMGRADWNACQKKAEDWCNALRVGKELWRRGAESKQRAIDGRVYHEAYAGTWVSYDVAARSQGVTGYQFRAPGEWLSELYAAYRSKKLKSSHPANAWLETL